MLDKNIILKIIDVVLSILIMLDCLILIYFLTSFEKEKVLILAIFLFGICLIKKLVKKEKNYYSNNFEEHDNE